MNQLDRIFVCLRFHSSRIHTNSIQMFGIEFAVGWIRICFEIYEIFQEGMREVGCRCLEYNGWKLKWVKNEIYIFLIYAFNGTKRNSTQRKNHTVKPWKILKQIISFIVCVCFAFQIWKQVESTIENDLCVCVCAFTRNFVVVGKFRIIQLPFFLWWRVQFVTNMWHCGAT